MSLVMLGTQPSNQNEREAFFTFEQPCVQIWMCDTYHVNNFTICVTSYSHYMHMRRLHWRRWKRWWSQMIVVTNVWNCISSFVSMKPLDILSQTSRHFLTVLMESKLDVFDHIVGILCMRVCGDRTRKTQILCPYPNKAFYGPKSSQTILTALSHRI